MSLHRKPPALENSHESIHCQRLSILAARHVQFQPLFVQNRRCVLGLNLKLSQLANFILRGMHCTGLRTGLNQP